MEQNVKDSHEVSHMDLLHLATIYGDLQAWEVFQQSLKETVLSWFHEQPGSKDVSRVYSERHFASLAFERLRKSILQRQINCETLSDLFIALRACLNGAILEALHDSERTGAVSSLRSDEEDHLDGSEIWNRLQKLLSNERERRLAYLLYHCGLSPVGIVRGFPQEWSDVQEVMSLRRSILAQLMKGLNCEGQTFV